MHKGQYIYSLEALTSDELATRNSQLFAALCAMGVPPEIDLCGEYIERKEGKDTSVQVWRMAARSACGQYTTKELIAHWNDPHFVERHPEHPFAYIKAAFACHSSALAFIREQGPIVVSRRGKKIALITRKTSPEMRKHIIDELNK